MGFEAVALFSIFRSEFPSVQVKTNESFVYAVLLELGLGVSAIAVGFFLGVNPREHLVPWWDVGGILKSVALGAVVGTSLAIAMQVFSLLPFRSIRDLDRSVQSQLKTFLGPMGVPELLLLSLSAGIGEELLFRGLIQGWWLSFYENPTMQEAMPGILVSALCFGFAHPLSKAYIAIASLAGILFSVMYWATNDLLACVLAHAIYDAIICVYWKWSETRNRHG